MFQRIGINPKFSGGESAWLTVIVHAGRQVGRIMTGWQTTVKLPELIDVFACNYYKCPFIGLEEDFRFNPSFRTSKGKSRSGCPHCGQLGLHTWGSISKKDFKKYGLRLMRWQYRYFLHRDGKVGITSKMNTRSDSLLWDSF